MAPLNENELVSRRLAAMFAPLLYPIAMTCLLLSSSRDLRKLASS